MKYCVSIIVWSLLLVSSASIALEQNLRTSYYRQNMAPQLFFDKKDQPISGILFDITHAIANRLDLQLEMLPIPRKRVEQSLVRNIIDMHCAANKKWYTLSSLQWSSVIYKNRDVLINNAGMTALSDLTEQTGLKIGTTLGFVYPELATYLDNKNILPIASVSPAENYKKYRKNKLAGFIIPEVEAANFIDILSDSVVILNDNDIRCVLAPSMKESRVVQVNHAIEHLKASGEIAAILEKYNSNAKPVVKHKTQTSE